MMAWLIKFKRQKETEKDVEKNIKYEQKTKRPTSFTSRPPRDRNIWGISTWNSAWNSWISRLHKACIGKQQAY
jgi:hypothetical protein